MILAKPLPRTRRRDAALGRILDEATALIGREGLEGLSMARLAEAVDYTPGALYRYFTSKDELLSRLVQRTLTDVIAALAAAEHALDADAPALAHVVALVDGYRLFARREPHRFGLLALTLADPRVLLAQPAHAEPAATGMIGALRPLAEALARAVTAGELTDGLIADRTICLFAMLQGVLQLTKLARLAPAALDVARLTDAGTGALLLGWGATPAHVDAAFTHARATRSASPGASA